MNEQLHSFDRDKVMIQLRQRGMSKFVIAFAIPEMLSHWDLKGKKSYVHIHKSKLLLSVFSLKLQWIKDNLKNAVWNRCLVFLMSKNNQSVIVNNWIAECWSEWVEAGLICIFIKPHILNVARVSSYIQAILKHEKKSKENH